MDMSWVTERIALGGGIWNERNMAELVEAGVTHVLNMQLEFDDRPLAKPLGVDVLWNPTDDDFLPKPPELLQRGVDFAVKALGDEGRGSSPGADDDTGGAMRDGVGYRGGDGADRDAPASGRFRRRLRGERTALSGNTVRERVRGVRLEIRI
jgi:hypothetical protein